MTPEETQRIDTLVQNFDELKEAYERRIEQLEQTVDDMKHQHERHIYDLERETHNLRRDVGSLESTVNRISAGRWQFGIHG